MDTQTIINLIGGAILAVMGWFARELWGAVKQLQRDIVSLEVLLPNDYVKKEEFSKGIEEIKKLCDKIFDKIDSLNDRKADK